MAEANQSNVGEKRFFKVDLHTHILPKELPDLSKKYGYGGWISLEHHKSCCAKMMIDGKFFREVQSNCYMPEERLKDCDRTGVDVQVPPGPPPKLLCYYLSFINSSSF